MPPVNPPDAPTPNLRLQCLGDLALYRGKHLFGEARRKPLAVLAYLAGEAPRDVNREVLAALLWPESSPERARHTLTQTIYGLRQQCGTDVILGATQLALNAERIGSDVADFLNAVARHDADAAQAAYTGPFLDGYAIAGGVEFEAWAERTRARLARLHRDVLLNAAEQAVDRADDTAALRYLSLAQEWYPDDVYVAERLATQYLVTDAAHLAVRVINMFERRLEEEHQVALPDSLRRIRHRLQVDTTATAPRTADLVTSASEGEATPPVDADTRDVAVSPHATRPARSDRRDIMLGLGALAAALVLYVASPLVQRTRATPAPATYGQLGAEVLKQRIAEQHALVDSAHVGRVLVLPVVTVPGAQDLDRLGRALDVALPLPFLRDTTFRWAGLRPALYTNLVPRSELAPLLAEIASRRISTTTRLQVAELMQRTNAPLAIQPVLSRRGGDTLQVRFTIHRDFSHTHAARPGDLNIESSSFPSLIVTATSQERLHARAVDRFVTAVRSMESCDISFHATTEALPWCWEKRRRLRLALTPAQARQLQEQQRQRMLELARLDEGIGAP